MEIDFWKQRWNENQIGFHESETNPFLVDYWSALESTSSLNVFVPLCGKSLDLVWLLNQGHQVLGLECSELAVESFFKEQQVDVKKIEQQKFTAYTEQALTILLGDFFDVNAELLEEVDVVFDRAAMVALPEQMRQAYVQKMIECLPQQVKILLIALEYDQSVMSGPPFSVSTEEIEKLYGSEFEVRCLHEIEVIESRQNFKQQGLKSLKERVYVLQRK